MIDLDGIVLSTLQNTWARTITVTPVVSQPGVAAYSGRGVFSNAPVDVLAEANLVFSDQKPAVWIRISEYSKPPQAGDQIAIPAYLNAPTEGSFEVLDTRRYADGKMVLTLKKPPQ